MRQQIKTIVSQMVAAAPVYDVNGVSWAYVGHHYEEYHFIRYDESINKIIVMTGEKYYEDDVSDCARNYYDVKDEWIRAVNEDGCESSFYSFEEDFDYSSYEFSWDHNVDYKIRDFIDDMGELAEYDEIAVHSREYGEDDINALQEKLEHDDLGNDNPLHMALNYIEVQFLNANPIR